MGIRNDMACSWSSRSRFLAKWRTCHFWFPFMFSCRIMSCRWLLKEFIPSFIFLRFFKDMFFYIPPTRRFSFAVEPWKCFFIHHLVFKSEYNPFITEIYSTIHCLIISMLLVRILALWVVSYIKGLYSLFTLSFYDSKSFSQYFIFRDIFTFVCEIFKHRIITISSVFVIPAVNIVGG